METIVIEDLRWFFSTIAQTLGAVVGLVGMVCVYRLQGIYSSKWDIMQGSDVSREESFGISAHGQSAVDFIEAWSNMEKEGIPHLDRSILDATAVGLTDLLDMQASIKFRLIAFLIVNLTIIFGFIVALPFCEFLSAYRDRVIFEAVVFVIISLSSTVWLSYALIPPGRRQDKSKK